MQRLKEITYTKEEKALLKRLAGFTAVYKRAAQQLLDTAAERYPEAKETYQVPTIIDVDEALFSLIPDDWSDMKDRASRYSRYHETDWKEYWWNVLNPLHYQTIDAFRDWWKSTYETNLDYSYPQAPDPLPTQIIKVNQRTYRIGQFELRFLNEQRFRKVQIWVKAGSIDEWYEQVNLRTLPQTIHTIYAPRMLPLLALCDWDQFETFTQKQKEALAFKFHPLKKAWKEQTS